MLPYLREISRKSENSRDEIITFPLHFPQIRKILRFSISELSLERKISVFHLWEALFSYNHCFCGQGNFLILRKFDGTELDLIHSSGRYWVI